VPRPQKTCPVNHRTLAAGAACGCGHVRPATHAHDHRRLKAGEVCGTCGVRSARTSTRVRRRVSCGIDHGALPAGRHCAVCRRLRAQRYRDRHRLRLRRAANLRYERQIRAEDAGLPTDRSERRIAAAIRSARTTRGPQPCERCGRSAEPFGIETAGPTGPVEIYWSCHSCRTQISNAIAERLESEAQDAMWRRIAGVDRQEPQPSPTPVIRRRRRKKEHVAGTPSTPPRPPVPQLTLAELEERDAEFDRRFADVDDVLARIERAVPARQKTR